MNSRYKLLLSLLAPCLFAHGEETPIAAPPPKDSHLQFTITPKSRALDFLQAFNFLRQEKTAFKVAFILKDGSAISNIIDIQLMDQGSLFIIRYNTGQGMKFRILGLEEVLRLEPL